MSESRAFTLVCSELEQLTRMTRLEARGTVRLALKEAGLTVDAVRNAEMLVVLKKVMPQELASRGVASGEETCRTIAAKLAGVADSAPDQTPEAVFSRLAGEAR